MLAYIKSEKASDEDRAWFKSIVGDPAYQREYTNQLDGSTYIDIHIPMVREQFCKRFFPNLLEKKKAKSFIDEIMDL